MRLRFPDFYLVGAPKCGTTAFYDFLGQHPRIFLPEKKELLFFGSDLSYPTRLSRDDFLAHFSGSQSGQLTGTAHTAYLQSTRAAKEIQEERPDARIIVMLRNPVEMLPSWHSELLYETVEDIEDFDSALDAEHDRRHGERIPANARSSYVESLFYSEVAAFADQVKRYLDAFGDSQVHVIIHDDLRSDPRRAYAAALEFLGLDATFVPRFGVVNANKVVRSRPLQRLYFATSAPGHHAVRKLIPRSVRQALLALNRREEPRPQLSPATRQRLERIFAQDVARLGDLLGRDLSAWMPGKAPAGT
jgi:Sulfotransferase domain